MNSKSHLREDLKSPWLRAIIGTIVIAVIANATIIFLSFYYPHSLVAKDYYNKGKEYFHEKINQENEAERLGYKLMLMVPEGIKVNDENQIRLIVTDRSGQKVSDGSATLFAYRANDNTKDFKIILQPASEGQFISSAKFSLPGTWDLIAQITVSGEKLDVAKRIFVQKIKK